MMKMTLSKRKAIIWLAVFAAVYSWCVNTAAKLLPPTPRVKLQSDGPLGVIGFSPDGKVFATTDVKVGDFNGIQSPLKFLFPIRIWSASTGEPLSRLDIQAGSFQITKRETPDIITAVFSPQGSELAVSSGTLRSIFAFDLAKGEVLKRITSHIEVSKLEFEFTPQSDKIVVFDWLCLTDDPVKAFRIRNNQVEESIPEQWHASRLLPDTFPLFDRPLMALSTILLGKERPWRWATTHSKCGEWIVLVPPFDNNQDSDPISLQLFNVERDDYVAMKAPFKDVLMSRNGQKLFITSVNATKEVAIGEGLVESCFHVQGLPELTRPMQYRLLGKGEDNYQRIAASLLSPRTLGESVRLSDSSESSAYIMWDTTNSQVIELLSLNTALMASTADESKSVSFDIVGENRAPKVAKVVWRDASTNSTKELREAILKPLQDRLAISCEGNMVAIGAGPTKLEDIIAQPLARNVIERVSKSTRVDIAKHLFGVGSPSVELWDGPAGKQLASIRDQYLIGFSADNKTLATQNEAYEVFFWDVAPGRNWSFAAGLAVVPAIVVIGAMAAFYSLVARTFRRLRACAGQLGLNVFSSFCCNCRQGVDD